MAYMRVTHRDEEGKKVTEKLPVPEARRPDTAKYIERKLEEQGFHRFERHPANAPRGVGIGTPPPKSGRGGKYTWELSITDTRYADTGTGTAIRRFSKNKDTPIRQVYIFLKT